MQKIFFVSYRTKSEIKKIVEGGVHPPINPSPINNRFTIRESPISAKADNTHSPPFFTQITMTKQLNWPLSTFTCVFDIDDTNLCSKFSNRSYFRILTGGRLFEGWALIQGGDYLIGR